MNRAIAVLVTAALISGCFGYNKSAKRWAYAGDTVLILGGAVAIAADLLIKGQTCGTGPGFDVMPTAGRPCAYEPPVSGALVAGAVLVAAGLFGMIFNATRPNVKTSR